VRAGIIGGAISLVLAAQALIVQGLPIPYLQYTEHYLIVTRLNKVFLLFILTSVLGVLLSFLPFMQSWEEDLGLSWLFHSRGVLPSPESVVVVSIDQSSSRYFNLPNLARKWPRTLHADLLARMRQAGARVVAFDIFFKSSRPGEQDAQLARAIRDADNVVLFSFLQKQVVNTVDDQGRQSRLVLDELLPPQPQFAEAALALAPNPLPKVPIKVSQFWKFVPEAGDAPTLPVVAYQLYRFDYLVQFTGMLAGMYPRVSPVVQWPEQGRARKKMLVAVMKQLREWFIDHRDYTQAIRLHINGPDIKAADRRPLLQLLDLYAGEASQHLNYYGPARSVTTVPYYKLLESDELLATLRDKLVFVGFSEHRQWEQQDGFYSVYSSEDGLDISGVEITASAAANLLDDLAVRPLALYQQAGLFVLFAALLVSVFYRLRGVWLPVVLIALGVAYFALAAYLFSLDGAWLPVFIPLFVLVPFVMLLGMIWNYQEINVERKNIQRAFGYYLPEDEVDRLARDIADHGLGGQLMHGVCLSTDAQQYTSLSEQLSPQQLTAFMNAYYEAIFKPVREQGGIISDVVGDSVMALWASPAENTGLREQAVKAAIAIVESVNAFNRQHPEHALPTRVGLHYGTMVIGNVGAVDHYEYRAVGDIVNTASRIEGMNKYLGTRILVSDEVLQGVSGFALRDVGQFTLKGKTVPIRLFELDSHAPDSEEAQTRDFGLLKQGFETALCHFQRGNWLEAGAGFDSLLQQYADDGPSRFYMESCLRYRNNPPENWNGVVRMEDK